MAISKRLEIGELSIVVVAERHNPTILNPDFLIRKGIVPEDWKLEKNPVCTDPFAEVIYATGTVFVAQFDKLIFTETRKERIQRPADLANMVKKYVSALPEVTYKAVGINPQGHILCENREEAQKAIVDNLLKDNSLKNLEGDPVHASVRYRYGAGESMINISVDEALIKLPDSKEASPAMILGANFHRELVGENQEQKFEHLLVTLGNVENDCKRIVGIMEDVFLKELLK
jgi:hypothetical protein